MSKTITGIVDWLKNWFYTETEVNTLLNAKANKNQGTANYDVVTDSSGEITVEPKINVASGSGLSLNSSTKALSHSNSVTAQSNAVFKKIKYDGQGHITGTSNVSSSDLPSHTHSAGDVTDANANNYTHIGSLSSNATQQSINSAIDTAISNLQSINAIEVVSTLPTASSSTIGKLYIVSENSKINVYYTEEDNGSYSWHKMDADILDELSIDWTDVQNKPSSFTPSAHTHGSITNTGKLANQFNKPVITDSAGSITAGSFGTSSGTFAEGNHTHSNYVTSIDLVPYATDNTGAIILYYGDEPSSS